MLSIYICEDEEEQLNKLRYMVNKSILMHDFDVKIALSTMDPSFLLEEVKKAGTTGLYFLDIDFKQEMNGFTLANEIRKYDPRGFIVFVTTHSEMSYMAFEYGVEALDYILKDMPSQMENRVYQCIIKAYERYCHKSNKDANVVQIKYEDKIIYLSYNEIIYIDSSVTIHKLDIHTTTSIISFYGSLITFEDKLNNQFQRCHKSFIVNLEYVKEIDSIKKEILLTNGHVIPTSMKYIRLIHGKLKSS